MKHLAERIVDQNMGLKKGNKVRIFSLLSSNVSSRGSFVSGENSLYECFFDLKMSRGLKAGALCKKVVRAVRPVVSLKKKKVGGSNYRIPVYLIPQKGRRSAVKWVVQSSCGRKMGSRQKCLGIELSMILRGQGKAMDKKRALYQQALLNRAFIKYL